MDRDYSEAEHERFANAVRWCADDIAELLISKNKQYGNAALNPIQVFTRGQPVAALINARLDDKLSRIQLGDPNREDEDVERDILGYLILKAVAKLMDEGNEGILAGGIRRSFRSEAPVDYILKGIEGLIFDELQAGPAVELEGEAANRWLAEAIVSKIKLPMGVTPEGWRADDGPIPKGSDAAYAEDAGLAPGPFPDTVRG